MQHHIMKNCLYNKAALVWVLLCIVGLGVFGIEHYTIEKLKYSLVLKREYTRFNITPSAILSILYDNLNYIDITLVSITILSTLAIFIGEIRFGIMREFFERIFLTNSRVLFLLIFLGAIGTLYYWAPGYILAGDASGHVIFTNFMAESLKKLHFPFWTNYWSLASPFLQFYGPLYFFITGVITLLFGDVTLGTKFFLFLIHIISGISVFLYVLQISKDVRAALIGGVVYVYAFAHTHLILWRGALPQTLILALFPLAMYYLEKYLQGVNAKRSLSLFAIVCAFLIISHPASGMYSGWFIILYIAIYFSMNIKEIKSKIIPLLAAGCLSLVMSSFVFLPMIYEKGFLCESITLSQKPVPGIGVPKLQTLLDTLVWHNSQTRTGGDLVTYLGLTAVILALFSIVYFIKRRNRVVIFLTVGLVFAFIARASHLREIIYILTFISTLAGLSLLAMEDISRNNKGILGKVFRKITSSGKEKIAYIILGVILLDLFPTTIQSVYRSDKEYIIDMGKKLEKIVSSGRTIETTHESGRLGVGTGTGGTPLMYFSIPMVFGPSYEAPLTRNYGAVIVKRAISELNKNRSLSYLSIQGLSLLNVKYILANDRSAYILPVLPENEAYYANAQIPAIEMRHPQFAFFSNKISSRYELSENLDKELILEDHFVDYAETIHNYTEQLFRLISDMKIDINRGLAEQIFVKDHYEHTNNSYVSTDLEMNISKLSYNDVEVNINLSVNSDGFVQLSYPYYPFLDISIDGRQTKPLVSAMNLIVLPITKGKHDIMIRPQLSPLRQTTFIVSMLAILIASFIAWKPRSNFPV